MGRQSTWLACREKNAPYDESFSQTTKLKHARRHLHTLPDGEHEWSKHALRFLHPASPSVRGARAQARPPPSWLAGVFYDKIFNLHKIIRKWSINKYIWPRSNGRDTPGRFGNPITASQTHLSPPKQYLPLNPSAAVNVYRQAKCVVSPDKMLSTRNTG